MIIQQGGTVVFPPVLSELTVLSLDNDCKGLGMRLQALLVFLGTGPDCIIGLVTHTQCDVYRGGLSHMMACLCICFEQQPIV